MPASRVRLSPVMMRPKTTAGAKPKVPIKIAGRMTMLARLFVPSVRKPSQSPRAKEWGRVVKVVLTVVICRYLIYLVRPRGPGWR
jgi:hypothetical protein